MRASQFLFGCHGFYSCVSRSTATRLGENVTMQMRDWQEAIDFFAEIPQEEIDLRHFGEDPVTWALDRTLKVTPLFRMFGLILEMSSGSNKIEPTAEAKAS